MTTWIECVPNFSEGRNRTVIDALAHAARSVPGAHLLDVHSDAFHHRSVLTLAGEAEAVCEAVFRTTQIATDRIDLTLHEGEHPRVGATDIVPLVPLGDTSMDTCVGLARSLAARIGAELDIPVFLYGHAARAPEHRYLTDLRRGGLASLGKALPEGSARTPDCGPDTLHPTAGATAVGARTFLVAYNIFLDTPDKTVAERIAARVRASSGGLPAVQAKGFDVGGRAQVSMNLLDITTTTPAQAFSAVARIADDLRVGVWTSEFVGLVPEQAVANVTEADLKLATPLAEHLLEPKLRAARSS